MPDDFFSRKQNLAAIIRISFDVFKKNIKYIALAGLFFILPLNLILTLIPMPSFAEVQGYLLNHAMNLNLTNSPEFNKLTKYMYSILGIAILFSPLSAGVAAYLTNTHINSETSNFHGFLDSSIVKWGKLSLTSLLYNLILGVFIMASSLLLISGIGAFIGFILVIPAVIYGIGYSFYTVVVVTTDKWSLEALRESYRVVRPVLISAIGFRIGASAMSYIFTLIFTLIAELFISLTSTAVPGAFYIVSFICGVTGDTLRLYFLILPAIWFMNRKYLVGNYT